MSLYSELKRRNVFRVAIAYLAAAWLVTEVSETIFPLFGYGNTPARIVVMLLAIGFPLFLIFSWVYEITPEGLKLEKDVIREESITPQTGKRIDRLIIVLLIAAVSYFAVDKFILEPARVAQIVEEAAELARTEAIVGSFGDRSIAVLPFVNMSGDPEQEYFADGISEELLNRLSKISDLRVTARTSSFSFKGRAIKLAQVAEELNVVHILEGSVRKAGNRVRITAQLIEARSDTYLWSETYDRKLDDIFAIQDEISSQIARALKITLGTNEQEKTIRHQTPTTNLEAYELYLRGRYFLQRRGEDNIRRAIDLFTQVTALDPQFARGWSSLAVSHATLPAYSDAKRDEHGPLAISAAQKALMLDDSSAEAYAVLGSLASPQWSGSSPERNWTKAEALYLNAIASEPKNPNARLWYGEALVSVGRLRDGLKEVLTAYELDPLHPGVHSDLALIYLFLDDARNALKYGAWAWDGTHTWGLQAQVFANLRLGDFDRAIGLAEQFDEQRASKFKIPVKTLQLFVEAKRDAAKRSLFLETLAEHEAVLPLWVSVPGYSAFGRIDDAYRVANMTPDPVGPRTNDWWILWRDEMAPFRQDSRFAELATELGLTEYWLEFGWPDFCQPTGDSLICQ